MNPNFAPEHPAGNRIVEVNVGSAQLEELLSVLPGGHQFNAIGTSGKLAGLFRMPPAPTPAFRSRDLLFAFSIAFWLRPESRVGVTRKVDFPFAAFQFHPIDSTPLILAFGKTLAFSTTFQVTDKNNAEENA